MSEIFLKNESFTVVGICMGIHRVLGMGLKEINYKDAMEIDFIENRIPFEREKRYVVKYKNAILRNSYNADFIVYESIVLEIKSAPIIHQADMAQALSYLAVTGLKLAIIINFGERSLTYKRIIL
ncbi:MAG: GxxExxY protein [Ferruginibacter sp.]